MADFAPLLRPVLDLDPTACRALWCSVLAAGWLDAFPAGDGGVFHYRQSVQLARQWFGSAGFFEVCALAGFEGHAVLDKFRARLAAEAEVKALAVKSGAA